MLHGKLLACNWWELVGGHVPGVRDKVLTPWLTLTCPVQTQRLQDVGPCKLHPQGWDVQGQRPACPRLVSTRLWWSQRPLPAPALYHWARHQAVNKV